MASMLERRLRKIEIVAAAKMVSLQEVLRLLDAMAALFHKWEREGKNAHAKELYEYVESWSRLWRSGDVKALDKKIADWRKENPGICDAN